VSERHQVFLERKLREAIADMAGVSPDHVQITTGAQEALWLVFLVAFDGFFAEHAHRVGWVRPRPRAACSWSRETVSARRRISVSALPPAADFLPQPKDWPSFSASSRHLDAVAPGAKKVAATLISD
jgi:hypothetical protein